MRKVLVIGATGFIGRAACERLCQDGHEVTALSRNAHKLDARPLLTRVSSSLDNDAVLDSLLSNTEIILHLASDSTPAATAGLPALEASLNVLPTLRLLTKLHSYPHVRFVFVSTGGAMYAGEDSDTPIDEGRRPLPKSYYAAGKLAIETFLNAFALQVGGRVLVIRPSNVYGPGQPYRPGFGVIPTILHHLQEGTPMTVWGTGEEERDYIHVDDFVELLARVVDADSAHAATPHQPIHASTGIGTSINTLCALAESASGRRLQRQFRDIRAVDARRVTLDNGSAFRAFQWRPSITIDRGMAQCWRAANLSAQA